MAPAGCSSFGSTSQVPKFYDDVPPAPEGLLWWKYAPGVPPLPTVASVLGSAFSSYQWRYDPDYTPNSFEFTNLDRVGAHRPTPELLLVRSLCACNALRHKS